ncbi:MAG: VWA domain-containing protein, partial [Deltaproteobacteria bacterium]|nr:VWA domain-containing protein [Deltaproteobacteria bacterium]
MRQSSALFCSLGLAALLAGCPDRTISEVNPQQGRVEYKDIPVTVNRNIDILFVVDDSGSMADKQANLRANFAGFINVLNTIEGGLPDVHIGVISSDMGTKGIDGAAGPGVGTVGQGGCAASGDDGKLQLGQLPQGSLTGTFISDIKQSDGSRMKNYTGDLAMVFGQMATVGATGCGFEQHLWSMQRSLQNTTANPGFLRPDAFL